jgi:hypothetical protein
MFVPLTNKVAVCKQSQASFGSVSSWHIPPNTVLITFVGVGVLVGVYVGVEVNVGVFVGVGVGVSVTESVGVCEGVLVGLAVIDGVGVGEATKGGKLIQLGFNKLKFALDRVPSILQTLII